MKRKLVKTIEPCIAILGLGLMGASLALALRKNGYTGRLVGCARSPKIRREAIKRNIVDEAHADPTKAVQQATLVVLCVPIRTCVDLAVGIAPALRPDAIVTDVASTKNWLCCQFESIFPTGIFVGSHPIAGSEKQGLNAAKADLFENTITVVVPNIKGTKEAHERIFALWRTVGSRIAIASQGSHDRILARTSHLPHVVAAALSNTVGRDFADTFGPFCGTGFRDTTRIAAGSVPVWEDILVTNAPAIVVELKAFQAELKRVYDDLREGRFAQVVDFLENAQTARVQLLQKHTKSTPPTDD